MAKNYLSMLSESQIHHRPWKRNKTHFPLCPALGPGRFPSVHIAENCLRVQIVFIFALLAISLLKMYLHSTFFYIGIALVHWILTGGRGWAGVVGVGRMWRAGRQNQCIDRGWWGFRQRSTNTLSTLTRCIFHVCDQSVSFHTCVLEKVAPFKGSSEPHTQHCQQALTYWIDCCCCSCMTLSVLQTNS